MQITFYLSDNPTGYESMMFIQIIDCLFISRGYRDLYPRIAGCGTANFHNIFPIQ